MKFEFPLHSLKGVKISSILSTDVIGNKTKNILHKSRLLIIWALTRQNLSPGFPTKQGNCDFACSKFTYDTFQKVNIKGADQYALMCRLVCTFVVRKPPKTGFLMSRPISCREY